MMVKKSIPHLGLAGVVILVCFCLVGWGETWEEIERDAADIVSIRAEFSQYKHLKILAKPLVSQGRFYFQKPDSIRWEYRDPVKSVLLMHRGDVRRFTVGSRGLVEEAAGAVSSMQIVVREIGLWSQGRFRESDHFRAEIRRGGEGTLVLTPRDKAFAAMIERIEIVPSPRRKGAIKSVKIVESEGNFTLLTFANVEMNEKIAETVFRNAE
ncbi:MAG: outer membrane lipoprotein carrier protein LolA [Syntrophales bacterium]|jgi:outer membrane lipoprotein-sorting protein|nr:outer membrane lipoprotein carrier protein LolA [Syntrophales bacterium]